MKINKIHKANSSHWWYRWIRAINWFAFRYWWFVWTIFILGLLWYYFFCCPVPNKSCFDNEFRNRIDNINDRLNDCCDCQLDSIEDDLPIFGLEWDLNEDNPCSSGNNWKISKNNTVLRYDIIDSKNCGGTCSETQSASAIAHIQVGDKDTYLYLDFDGIGELHQPEYELIEFKLNGILLANAHAAGGNKGCQFGEVKKKYFEVSPYFLERNKKYEFEVNFTTNDAQFHVDCYYEVRLKLKTEN